VIPFYFKKNTNLEFIINNNSILFIAKFYSKIKLIKYENENELNIDISFNNLSIHLNEKNDISEFENEKLINNTLSFKTKNLIVSFYYIYQLIKI
jgi:hypothetical protein